MTNSKKSYTISKKQGFFKVSSQILKKDKRMGFSIIELLVATVIIGLLAAIAVPSYFEYKNRAEGNAIHTQIFLTIKNFNVCMLDTEQDDSYCSNEINESLKGSYLFNINFQKIVLGGNTYYVFTSNVQNETYKNACFAVDKKGKISSITYGGGASLPKKICYNPVIPSSSPPAAEPPVLPVTPITSCENSDCASGGCYNSSGSWDSSVPSCI